MNSNIRALFLHHLSRLQTVVKKTPEAVFPCRLASDMFSLEMNAKIAANFILRGYCPLLATEVVSFYREEEGKAAVLKQIEDTIHYLQDAGDVGPLDDTILISDKAGFNLVELGQSEYVHRYILPNFLFHMSMVYAIARAHGVALSKGDFDGLHGYPADFSFV